MPGIEHLYREATGVRAVFGADAGRALAYYAPLVQFVAGVSASGRLLDVGCGSGWSTLAFARAGYDATGIDLNPRAFEATADPEGSGPRSRCDLREGSATDIPFPADSFDAVACYQCLEHVPDPQRALGEMCRVCRPGGVVCVVGPNLVSPFPGLLHLARHPRTVPLRRGPGMPRHPYGNTLGEILGVAVARSCQLVAKLFRRTPHFTMREPDTVPPFHADNDACYLCCPADLIAYFRARGFRVLRRGRPGRPGPTYLFAGGTWVAARKPRPGTPTEPS
jgi:SAM-dependent methyltransferase